MPGLIFFGAIIAGLVLFVIRSVNQNKLKALEKKAENDRKVRRDAQKYFYERYTSAAVDREVSSTTRFLVLPYEKGESISEYDKRQRQMERDFVKWQNDEFTKAVSEAMNIPEAAARMLVDREAQRNYGTSNIEHLKYVVLAAKKGKIYGKAIDDTGFGLRDGWIKSYGADQEAGGINVFQVMKWVDKELRSHGVPEMIFIPKTSDGKLFNPTNIPRPYLVRTADQSVANRGGIYQWNFGEFTVGADYSRPNLDHFA